MSTPPDREVDAAADEVLEVGRPATGGRARWLLAVLALVVAVPVVVLAARHSTPQHRAVAPTASRTAGPSTVEPSPPPPRAPCRGIAGCVVRSTVPPAIAALARKHLSPDVELRVQTFVVPGSPGRLVERDLDAYFRSATVVIRIDHGSVATSPPAPDPPGVGSLLLHRINAGFDVRLQYLAPETVPPRMTDLLTLMRDPRLTAL